MSTNSNEISSFRRFFPQVLVTLIKDLILFANGTVDGIMTLIIPSLVGIATTLKPDETIRITGDEASWLSGISSIGMPFGGLLSGFFSDAFGRRTVLMLVMVPILATFIMLGMAESFWVVCLAFFLLSFLFALKSAASAIYVSEISEKSIRGTLLALTAIATNLGTLFGISMGSLLSWRQIAFVVSAFSVVIIAAIYFIPETPSWLLKKDRQDDALKSMQWLRGWASAETVNDEFTKLKIHNTTLNACNLCLAHSTQCQHLKEATFCDQIKELKQKRILKPFILIQILLFLVATSGNAVLRSYLIQVIKSFGIPLDANFTASILSAVNLAGTCCLLLSVRAFGKRRIYLGSATMMVLCCIGLSIYGYVFFPPNWTSFKNPSDPTIPDFDRIRDEVGNYGHLALALLIIMNFFSAYGFDSIPVLMVSEVYPFKLRSILCGLSTTLCTGILAISAKTYYNIELWLTLRGAILFYAMITLIGSLILYFILPETENRSLEDIEAHYADDTKKITDIHIPISSKSNQTDDTINK